MGRQSSTFGQHTSRYGLIALLGTFLILTLPFTGMLNLWIAPWITVPIMLATYGAGLFFAQKMVGNWMVWAVLVAGAMGFGTALESYDQRMRNAADELGPIRAQDIPKHPDALAFKLIPRSFNVGDVEGWHEVCGEDSCTEYVLLSLTLPNQARNEPINIWFEVAANELFALDYIFEKDTSSSPQEAAIQRACAIEARQCTEEVLILIPIAPEKSELTSPDAIEILGIVAGIAWLIPCLFGWIISYFRRRKKA